MLRVENLQMKRGGQLENDNYTGLPGTISIDYETQTIRVHDGINQGGLFRVKNLEELKDNNYEFIRSTWRGTALSGVSDYPTVDIDYVDPARIRVYVNDVEIDSSEWEVLLFDEETLSGTVRVLTYLEPGYAIRIDQFVTIQDIVNAVVDDYVQAMDMGDYVNRDQIAVPLGVASLDSRGRIPVSQLPKLSDLDYPVEHVYTTQDVIDLGDIDSPLDDVGTLDPEVPGDVLTIFDNIDFGLKD